MLNIPSILNVMNMGDHKEPKKKQPLLVKGYMRPDGTSYYVVIPKDVRELLGLKGGEYFSMKAKPEEGEIELKMLKLTEE
jgi:AbrB family looped-hinge helix DNA binding protein